MPRFACVTPQGQLFPNNRERVREFDAKPADLPHKGLKWLPVVEVGKDDPVSETQVKEGPVAVVTDNEVIYTWTVRAKNAQELDADKEDALRGIDRAQFEILFMHHNDIRDLKGQQPVTKAQFKAAIKARL